MDFHRGIGGMESRKDSRMRPEMARLTLARKLAAITLKIWKEGGTFNAEYIKPQAA